MSETMRTFALNGVTYEIGGVSPEVLRSKVDRTEVGAANGVASLDADGLIPDGQIPSSVGISGNALDITRARTA